MRRTRTRKPRSADRARGPRLTAFPPILGSAPRVLILGSLPGAASLAAGEYYAHPRNLFWDLMGELFGARRDLPYDERCRVLTDAGVAVWDVIHEAVRPGSLDADIVVDGASTRDFPAFLAGHPTLRAIAFNGRTAHALFRRHALPQLLRDAAGKKRLPELLVLPSTSPAHAGRTRAQKLALWHVVAEHAADR